ncbi:hypothetical protein C5O79_06225 [Burkholderia sp. SRS-25]|nr:hypothetical protein C5O79_06225 [Burkholderia sp. SRS-25]
MVLGCPSGPRFLSHFSASKCLVNPLTDPLCSGESQIATVQPEILFGLIIRILISTKFDKAERESIKCLYFSSRTPLGVVLVQ